jgi:hypothetical protein
VSTTRTAIHHREHRELRNHQNANSESVERHLKQAAVLSLLYSVASEFSVVQYQVCQTVGTSIEAMALAYASRSE